MTGSDSEPTLQIKYLGCRPRHTGQYLDTASGGERGDQVVAAPVTSTKTQNTNSFVARCRLPPCQEADLRVGGDGDAQLSQAGPSSTPGVWQAHRFICDLGHFGVALDGTQKGPPGTLSKGPGLPEDISVSDTL